MKITKEDVKKKIGMIIKMLIILSGIVFIIYPDLIEYIDGKTYDYDMFYANGRRKDAIKYIDNEPDFNGVYTYGPYINLPKGSYTGIIEYETDVNRTFELTSDFGATKLYTGELDMNTDELTFDFEIDSGIWNNSVELLTYYNGAGSFDFVAFTCKRNDFPINSIVLGVFLLLTFMAVSIIYKKFSYIFAIYDTLLFIILKTYFIYNPIIMIASACAIILFAWIIKDEKDLDYKCLFNGWELFGFIVTTFLCLSAVCLFKYDIGIENIYSVNQIVLNEYIALFVFIFHLIAIIRVLAGNSYVTHFIMLFSAIIFGFAIVHFHRNIYFCIGIILILGIFTYYVFSNNKQIVQKIIDGMKDYKLSFAIVLIGMVSVTLFYAYQTVIKYRAYGDSCFDFGIFSQMFEYMASVGKPLTTCERGYLLSHFKVHFSPIFYLFLPVYMIFRNPETLLVIQAVFVFTAVIPLFLICKKHKIKPLVTLAISYIYLFSPAIGQPVFFDFHENKFIPFFFLWFIYFFECDKKILTGVFLIMTLMIKEDTAIYLIIMALFYMLCDKKFKKGLAVLGISGAYFITVMKLMQDGGYSFIKWHYGLYFNYYQDGFGALVHNIMLNPGFFVKNVFAPENFEYIIYVLGALLFVPLINKDLKRLILVVPYIAFALMTDYSYQHDIGYQYTYGIMVLLIYLFILNLKDLPDHWKNIVCVTSLCAVVILSYNFRGDGFTYFSKTYKENKETYEATDQLLGKIPEDVSVSAETYSLTHLTNVKELYMVDDKKETDYYVFSNNQDSEYFRDFISNLETNGYEFVAQGGNAQIYKKITAPGLIE